MLFVLLGYCLFLFLTVIAIKIEKENCKIREEITRKVNEKILAFCLAVYMASKV